jgi:hypothetical protein
MQEREEYKIKMERRGGNSLRAGAVNFSEL